MNTSKINIWKGANSETTLLGYYSRQPQPRTYAHLDTAPCICPACLAAYRRSHPEEYTVPQAQPMNGAHLNDFTQELNATMKVLGTSTVSNHRAYIKVRTAKRTYANAAVILNV